MLKVVVVDDEPRIGVLCKRVLEHEGMEAVAFTDPLSALEYLRSERADVLLADVRMPVMDGFELLQHVRECCPSTAVVIMTAYGELDTALKALHGGADGMILKPFQGNQALAEAVRRGFAQRRRYEEAAQLHALLPLLRVAEALLSESAGGAEFSAIAEQVQTLFPNHDFGAYAWEGKQGECFICIGEAPNDERALERMRTALLQDCADDGCVLPLEWAAEFGWSAALLAGAARGERFYAILLGRKEGRFASVDYTVAAILARLIASAAELQHSLESERRAQEELAKANQQAALGRIMASLAHEFNNPLQTLRNSLYLALRNEDNPQICKHYLKTADSHAEYLVDIANRMLDFYRPDTASRRLISLSEIVPDVLERLTDEAQARNVKLAADLPTSLPKVFVAPQHIRYAIWHLAKDLLEAIPAGGSLHFRLANGNGSVLLEVSTTLPQNPALVENVLPEDGFALDTIGSAIAEGVVSAHGGKFSTAQAPSGGVVVKIYLPVAS